MIQIKLLTRVRGKRFAHVKDASTGIDLHQAHRPSPRIRWAM